MLGFATLAPVLPLWLFCTDPAPRRAAVLLALGCALACVGGIAVHQRASGGRQSYAAIALAEFSGAAESGGRGATAADGPPGQLPSSRSMKARSFGWYVGTCTALVTLLALAMGTPQRPEPMQRIVDAGAEFTHAQVEKVSDVQFHNPSRGRSSYTSTAVVRLVPGAGEESVTATVHPRTDDRPRPGTKVPVLHAPSHPELGAVAGDEDSLGWAVRGFTMRTAQRWFVGISWAAGIALSVVGISWNYGLRYSSGRRGPAMAVQGTFQGPGVFRRGGNSQSCLKVVTASSRTAHFLVPVTEDHVPESLIGQKMWLRFDVPPSAGNSPSSENPAPAALVSDDGWVMYGMLHPDDAQMMAAEGNSAEKTSARNSDPRTLWLWDPRSAWPLYVSRTVLLLAAAFTACAALLTFDVTGAWRWTIGISGVVTGLTLCILVTAEPHRSRIRAAVSEGGGNPA
ncbi:hypothetical protein ACN2WE_29635 [Streptomyces sp. cg28]|uniref:hypothetical protein n=1 Tax=Streptomyces sp. cg28 TaxID=3403457 RepID=UPI003B20CFC7